MLVVEVWTLRVPSASRLSAGRPECSSVMAMNEAHVVRAYPASSWSPDLACAAPAPTLPNTINAPHTATTLRKFMNLVYPSSVRCEPPVFRCDPLLGMNHGARGVATRPRTVLWRGHGWTWTQGRHRRGGGCPELCCCGRGGGRDAVERRAGAAADPPAGELERRTARRLAAAQDDAAGEARPDPAAVGRPDQRHRGGQAGRRR